MSGGTWRSIALWWSYEQEFRIVSSLEKAKHLNGMYFEPFSDQLRLREVIVGPACGVTEQEIRAITDQYTDGKMVKIIKARFRIVKNGTGFRQKP
jgi:hypothetical protein